MEDNDRINQYFPNGHSDEHESQPGEVPFLWTGQHEWMQQVQPIAPAHLPHATAPVVYEGYTPDDGSVLQQNYHLSTPAFTWSTQQQPSSVIDPALRNPVNESVRSKRSVSRAQTPGSQRQVRFSSERTFASHRHQQPTQSQLSVPWWVPPTSRPHMDQVIQSSQSAPAFTIDQASLTSNLYDESRHENATRDGTGILETDLDTSNYGSPDEEEDDVDDSDNINDTDLGDLDADDNDNETDIDAEVALLVSSRSANKQKGASSGELQRPTRGRRRKGRASGKNKDSRQGVRQAIDPGEEFHGLHAEATRAFLDEQNLDKATDLILQAISINPEIYSAHVLLSEIYFAQGDNEKAIATLFSGAHASPADPSIWHQLAEICLERSQAERMATLKAAVYCYSRLLGIDQSDQDARFQKAAISLELGHYAKALKDLKIILETNPYNSDIMQKIAEVYLEVGRVDEARDLYEAALRKYRSSITQDDEVFTWTDLLMYVDIVLQDQGVDQAIWSLKEVSRWLAGRESETYWNAITDDDREWDFEHNPRRDLVPEFQPGLHPVEAYGSFLPLELRVKLGDLRLQQGRSHEAIDHYAWLEPNILDDSSNLPEYQDLFLHVAMSLQDDRRFGEALHYYRALNTFRLFGDNADYWLGFGACSYVCDDKDDAILFYDTARALDPDNPEALTQLSKLWADNGDREKAMQYARQALIIYEAAVPKTQKRKYERKDIREARQQAQAALKKAYKMPKAAGVQDGEPLPTFSRRAMEKQRRIERETREQGLDYVPDISLDRPDPKPRRKITKARRNKEQQEQHVRELYLDLCENSQAMREGDDKARGIWIDSAEAMIEDFRSVKLFYPAERYKKFQGYDQPPARDPVPDDSTNQEDLPLPSIENIRDGYCDIPFSVWLDVFLEYALLLANLQFEPSECYTIISAAQDCTIWYHDTESMSQIYLCYLACALALQDEMTVFNTALRWFMREYAFCTDVYRLFSAINLYYPHSLARSGKLGQMTGAKFRTAPNQKFLFRHVVALDSSLPENYGMDTKYGPVPDFMRKERSETGYLRGNLQVHSNQTTERQIYGQAGTPGTPGPVMNTAVTSSQPFQRTFVPSELDSLLLVLYAQILYAGGSFPSALSYLYRAHSLNPSNPTILLSMSLCYIHQMLKRQSENRHMYVLQGLALFEQYADARMQGARAREEEDRDGSVDHYKDMLTTASREVEFNRARLWQMIGMADLATRGYAKMMDIKRIKGEDEDAMDVDGDEHKTEDFSMEAAYAMVNMYALSGDTGTAKEIAEKWLVVQ